MPDPKGNAPLAAQNGGALTRDSAPVQLRLYIAGSAPNSLLAIGNARELCNELFGDIHKLEIVDMLLHPQRGLDDGVIVTPTLVKLAPPPVQRVVGNLSNRALASSLLGRR